MENAIISSNIVTFVKTDIKDLDRILEIERDMENSKFVYNWTRKRHIEVMNSDNWLHLTVRDKEKNNIIGYILLDGLKSEDESIELTRIVISEKGKGYGRESIKLIKSLCFEQLRCHRLWLDVFDYNSRAISLYISEGFIQEGILRDCKKIDGEYKSMRVFSMLKGEYIEKNIKK